MSIIATPLTTLVEQGVSVPGWLLRAQAEAERVQEWVEATRRAVCVYCGEQAEHEDHLVPRHLSGEEWRKAVPTVPACADCNQLLSDLYMETIGERSAYVARQLRRKHKALAAPCRNCPDPEELDGTLRSYVEARQALRTVIRSRLALLGLGGAVEADPSATLD
ncbi:MAG: HNH endonuclease [Acidimicrobiales bacterium]